MSNLHEYFSNKFIQNVPVLIEKPLATTISDAKKIYMNANKFKIPVGVGYYLRYLPSSNIVKKLIQVVVWKTILWKCRGWSLFTVGDQIRTI